MKCPFCHEAENRVIDSRLSKDSNMIRRRRECERCNRRFTTYERVEEMMPLVVKKDGRRESYDRLKIINGLKRACEKRPVSIDTIEMIADRIERIIQERGEKEIASSVIGEALMRELHDTDPVAYVRFASVYRSFKDISEFMVELEELLKERKGQIVSPHGAPAGAKSRRQNQSQSDRRCGDRPRRQNRRHRLPPVCRRRSRGNRRAQTRRPKGTRRYSLHYLRALQLSGSHPAVYPRSNRSRNQRSGRRHPRSQSFGCGARLPAAQACGNDRARGIVRSRMPCAD